MNTLRALFGDIGASAIYIVSMLALLVLLLTAAGYALAAVFWLVRNVLEVIFDIASKVFS